MDRLREIAFGFCEFSQSTSIHGLRNIGDREKRLSSRIIWLTVICMSFCGAGYIIYGSVQGNDFDKSIFLWYYYFIFLPKSLRGPGLYFPATKFCNSCWFIYISLRIVKLVEFVKSFIM